MHSNLLCIINKILSAVTVLAGFLGWGGGGGGGGTECNQNVTYLNGFIVL